MTTEDLKILNGKLDQARGLTSHISLLEADLKNALDPNITYDWIHLGCERSDKAGIFMKDSATLIAVRDIVAKRLQERIIELKAEFEALTIS